MADPGYAPPEPQTQTATQVPGAPEQPAGGEATSQGVNLPLLLVLLLILVLVSWSNVWLRRRAEREERDPGRDEPG